ncbi:MAG: hypothetical protein ACKOYK_14085 [Cyanobium sp.]
MAGTPPPSLTSLPFALLPLFFAPVLAITPHPSKASSTSNPGLAATVVASTEQLRRSWVADPTTAALPFPRVRLLPAGIDANGACTAGAPSKQPAPKGFYCASSGEVLLEQDLLASAYRLHQNPAVDYWIAIGLAERLLPQGGTSPGSVVSNLQANCLAGVLLSATSGSKVPRASDALLKASASAYGAADNTSVGTPSQRAYALLSGYGATATGCSSGEMANLAKGSVTDPTRLSSLATDLRGSSSLRAAHSSQCVPSLPKRPCPRSVASSLKAPSP